MSSNDDKEFDSLDALFSAARSNEAYLPDDGFSDQVMGSLPRRSGSTLTDWKKNTLIISSAVLGSATAATLIPAIQVPVADLLASVPPLSFGVTTLLAAAAALFGLTGLTLWANHKELI